MAIKFCPKCSSILHYQKIPNKNSGILGDRNLGPQKFLHSKEKDKIFLKCKTCGFAEEMKEGENLLAGQKIKQKKEIGKDPIKDEDIFATHEFLCKKCGNTKAQIIDRGVAYSDEDHLLLLKCSKCGFSQRTTKKAS